MQVMFRQWNYGCMFPGSSCHTWTKTDGNTPCSLITFMFQYASLTISCRYVQGKYHKCTMLKNNNNNNNNNNSNNNNNNNNDNKNK